MLIMLNMLDILGLLGMLIDGQQAYFWYLNYFGKSSQSDAAAKEKD